MNVPVQISFHQVPVDPAAERLIRARAKKLEKLCDHVSSCRVTVEPRRKREVAAFRVRVTLTVPPAHELTAQSHPVNIDTRNLQACIRDAFDGVERRLRTLAEEQRRDVKRHEEQELTGVVDRIFPKEGYGFVLASDGGEVYFHAHSVLNEKFENLRPGMGVHYRVEAGLHGPQASTVRIVDKRGRPASG